MAAVGIFPSADFTDTLLKDIGMDTWLRTAATEKERTVVAR
jgi:hypothetical protein